MVSGLQSANYEERCKELKITTLAQIRTEQDLAQVFKIDKLEKKLLQLVGPGRTRQSADPLNLKLTNSRLKLKLTSTQTEW
jgi:hypothetical protein